NAQLAYPNAVAVDSNGNVYIADTQNYRIRKVTASTGIITTIAGTGTYGQNGNGGAATSAQIGWIQSLAGDSSAHVYIADGAIRRIASGTIDRFSPNGWWGYANTVAVGPGDAVYAGSNSEIDRVDGGTALVIAGYYYGFSGDGGPGTNASIDV